MKKKNAGKILTLIGALLFFGLCIWPEGGGKEESSAAASDETSLAAVDTLSPETGIQESGSAGICVYVYGAVSSPGVYELPEGSRVKDAVESAGGYLPEADPASRNPAGRIADGDMIYIAAVGESTETEQITETEAADGRVNINTADQSLLMTLPGIGEAKALAILEYRSAYGPFSSTEDIMLVSGIGEGLYSRIRERITV